MIFNQMMQAASSGASNVVSGTFTTGDTAGVTETVSVPYDGSGFPILIALIAEGGARGSQILSSSRPLVGYAAWKNYADSEPNYAGSAPNDSAGVCVYYKSSATSAASTTYRANGAQNVYRQTVDSNYGGVCISGKTQFKVMVSNTTTYCLYPSTTYRYVIVYSG